jgi:hypothetical protein
LTAFCPASTAIFGSRQGFATLLETTVLYNKAAINTTNNLFQPLSQAFENFMKIDVDDYEVDLEHKEKREGQATVIVLRGKTPRN